MGLDNNRIYIVHIILDFVILLSEVESWDMAVAIDDSTTILLHPDADDRQKNIAKKIRKSNFIINTKLCGGIIIKFTLQ